MHLIKWDVPNETDSSSAMANRVEYSNVEIWQKKKRNSFQDRLILIALLQIVAYWWVAKTDITIFDVDWRQMLSFPENWGHNFSMAYFIERMDMLAVVALKEAHCQKWHLKFLTDDISSGTEYR